MADPTEPVMREEFRSEITSLLVVGAGPAGLAVGIEAERHAVPCILVDRGTVVSTIERYPLGMTFFSTPERLEIGDVPFIASHEKPTRRDGLLYYRRVAEHFELDVRPGENAVAVARDSHSHYRVTVERRDGRQVYLAEAVVFATGYYDWPNLLGVPGEDLPHVHHYFREGHAYWKQNVVVVGAGNSSVDAALECYRAGAQVTIVHFGHEFDRTVKAWVMPDIINRVREESIAVRWGARLSLITPTEVEIVLADGGTERFPCDAVLAMTGYHADTTLLRELGVPVEPDTGVPAHDPGTMATPVRGIYVAGVLAAGNDANRLFIENTRHHGEAIVGDFLGR